jgi:uncharacterized protein with PQ loop repeat
MCWNIINIIGKVILSFYKIKGFKNG